MRVWDRSKGQILAGGVFFLIVAGWLFYAFGVEAFLEAAYAGDSWSYFNEYAARWRARQANPTLDAFLRKAQSLLFRYAVLGTTGGTLIFGLYALRPEAFTTFFSAKTSPYNLALFRIAIFGTLLAHDLGSVQFFAQLPESLRFPPPGLSVVLPFISTDPTLVFGLKLVFWGACICGILGLYTRLSATVALLSGMYVMGIPQLYGKISHYHHLIWSTALLIPSRCADVLSIDVLWKGGGSRPSRPEAARSYALPIRYAWLLLGILYFFPGFWKFVSEGLGWALSENVKLMMHMHWFMKGFTPFFRVDRYPILYQTGGALTLLFELGFVFTLPFRSVRPWAAGMAFLFHQSTRIFLAIPFWKLYPVLLFLFDIRKHLVNVARRLHPSPLFLEYDVDEPWQRRVVEILLRLDLFDRLRVRESGGDVEQQPETNAEERRVHLSGTAPDCEALWQEGRFQIRTGLRLVGHVPPALLLLPFVPFANGSAKAFSSTKSPQTTRIRALHVVGGVLILANVICGLAKINSYPFSVYPTFAVRAEPAVTTLRVTGMTPSGTEVDVLRGIQDYETAGFAAGRLRGLIRDIFRVDDAQERARKLRALWMVLQRKRDDLRAVTTVRFYEATYSTNPDRTTDPLLAKKLIATVDVSPRKERPSSGEG